MSKTTLTGIGLAFVAVGHAITGFVTGDFSAIPNDIMAVLAAFGFMIAGDASAQVK